MLSAVLANVAIDLANRPGVGDGRGRRPYFADLLAG